MSLLSKRLIGEGLWVGVGQFLLVAGALVGVRTLTEVLSPEQFGELSLGLTLSTLFGQLIFGPLGNGIARYYAPADESQQLPSYYAAATRLSVMAVCSVLTFFILAGLVFWTIGLAHWFLVGLGIALFTILSGVSSVLNAILSSARLRMLFAIHQGLDPWARFGFALLLVVAVGATSSIAIFGYCLGLTLVVISQFYWLQKSGPNARNISCLSSEDVKKTERDILLFSWPFATWGVFTWAQVVSDRWALGLYASTADVGLYSVLYQIGYYPLSLLMGMVVQFITPILYAKAGNGGDEGRNGTVWTLASKLCLFALGLTLIAVVLSYFLAPLIVRLFLGHRYWAIAEYLPFVVASGGIFASSQALTLGLLSLMKTSQMVVQKISTAVVGVGLNLLGAMTLGLQGVVYAGLAFSILSAITMTILAISQGRKKL